jgi:glutaredoxin
MFCVQVDFFALKMALPPSALRIDHCRRHDRCPDRPRHPPGLRGRIAGLVKDGDVVEFAEWRERVVVLTRRGCHLCDEAVEQVAAVCAETGEEYAVVDVDGDPELRRLYTDQVPVTFVDGAQHDFWRVDPVRLTAALKRTR